MAYGSERLVALLADAETSEICPTDGKVAKRCTCTDERGKNDNHGPAAVDDRTRGDGVRGNETWQGRQVGETHLPLHEEGPRVSRRETNRLTQPYDREPSRQHREDAHESHQYQTSQG